MFERYTEKAKLTIFRAKHEADEVGSREIKSAHILLALLKDAALAEQALRGISLQELREEILGRQPHQSRRLGPGDLPFSQEAKQMLTSVVQEAHKLGSPYVGNGLLWLALLQVEGSDVAQILREKGITVENVRPQIEPQISKENAEEDLNLPRAKRVRGANEATPLSRVVDVAKREGDRQALKLVDDLLADPGRDKCATLRELWFTATVLASEDLQSVKHYCEELLACDPDDPMALYVLADCFERQGHIEEARRYAAKSYANRSRSSSKALPDLLRSRWPDIADTR